MKCSIGGNTEVATPRLKIDPRAIPALVFKPADYSWHAEGHERSGRREDGRQLLNGRPALERHREPHLVVEALPVAERDVRGGESLEAVPTPELLGINPVAPLDLAVLVRPAGLDVSMADPPALDGEEEGERELCVSIRLQLPNGEWEPPTDLTEEVAPMCGW